MPASSVVRPSRRAHHHRASNLFGTALNFRDSNAIVSTEWLETHLDDADLRLFDCTVYLRPADPEGTVPYRPESGRADYELGHIPNAAFLDLLDELSDPDSAYFFMFPTEARFVAAMPRQGIGEGLRVVLYSAGHIMWATRVWWMLRAFGFDAAILDGGFEKWKSEGRRLSTEPVAYPTAKFVPELNAQLFVDKHAVLDAIDDETTLIINALAGEYYRGESPSRYGRPGRIPGSASVPAASLLNSDTHTFVAPSIANDNFNAVGVDKAERIIAYCGGGISATVDLFMLHQLGHDQLALYDASMGEWASDESLPIERD